MLKLHRVAPAALLLLSLPAVSTPPPPSEPATPPKNTGHSQCLLQAESALSGPGQRPLPGPNPELEFYEAYRVIGLKPEAKLENFEPTTGIFLKRDATGRILRNADGSPVEARMRVLTDNPGDQLFVIGDFNNWGKGLTPEQLAQYQLKDVPGTRYHEGAVPGLKHGQKYRFLLNGHEVLDPAGSLFITPEFSARQYGVSDSNLNSVFWDFDRPGAAHPSKSGPDLRRSHLSIGEQEFGYLIQAFPRPDGSGAGPTSIADTFAFVGDPDTRIASTFKNTFEYNALHVLPINQSMPGQSWQWRYQVYGLYAPDSRFGTPDDLIKAVDTLHQHGVAVLLDFLGSHVPYRGEIEGLGPASPAWTKENGQPLFTRNLTRWDTYRYDYENPYVRKFLIDSALYWFKRYNIDGIRIDNAGRDGIDNEPGGHQFLAELAAAIRKYRPQAVVIQESFNGSDKTQSLATGGLGANARNGTLFFNWFRENAQKKAEDLDMEGWKKLLADALREKEIAQIPYISNHDESDLAVGGATGAFVETLLSGEGKFHSRGKATVFDAASAVIGAYSEHTPYVRLMQTGKMSDNPVLQWSRLKDPDIRDRVKFLAALTKYVNQEPAFAFENLHDSIENHTDNANKVATVLRIDHQTGKRIYILLNFGPHEFRDYRFGVDRDKPLQLALDRDSREFGGTGRNEEAAKNGVLPVSGEGMHGKPRSVTVPFVAPYSVVVLEQN